MNANILIASTLFILFSCKKSGNQNLRPSQVIDVSQQCKTGDIWQITDSTNDGQWKANMFLTNETNLFTTLDTTSLQGTTLPDSVSFITTQLGLNPFDSIVKLRFRFYNGFNVSVIFKYVIVDSLMSPIEKNAIQIDGNYYSLPSTSPSISSTVNIKPLIPAGRYRLYFTLSSELNEHFYKCWGNIQKML